MTKMMLTVRGKTREHSFVVVDQQIKYLQEMWDDGLEIYVLVDEMPQWFPFPKLWWKICNLLNKE